MRFQISRAILLVFGVAILGCSESNSKKPTKALILPESLRVDAFQNTTPKFSIHFPKAFEKIEWDDEKVIIIVREKSGRVNMHLRCPPLPRPDITLSQLTQAEKKGLKGAQIINSGVLEGAEPEIAWTHFSGPREDGLILHTVVYTALHPPYSVLLFAAGTKDKFDEYRQAFDDSARSLRLE